MTLTLPGLTRPTFTRDTSHPLSRGLIGLYVCKPGYNFCGKTLRDLSVSRYHGSLTGASWSGTAQSPGLGSLYFDGSSYVDAGAQIFSDSGSQSYSAGCWFKTSGAGGLITQYNSAADGKRFGFRVEATKLRYWKGATGTALDSTVAVDDNRWHFGMFTKDPSGNLALYLDGRLNTTGTDTNAFEATNTQFGAFSASVVLLTGFISSVFIYDRVLSAAEVMGLYLESARGLPSLIRRRELFTVGILPTTTVGAATETDSAQSIAPVKSVTVGVATETDSAQAITLQKPTLVGSASESDSAQPVSSAKSTGVGTASEADTAQSVTPAKARTVGVASETDSAQAITVYQFGVATETDSAQSISSQKTLSVGVASESDSGQSIAAGRAVLVGLASEVAAAQPISWSKLREIGVATETDAAQAITLLRVVVDIRRRRGILGVADQRLRSAVQSDDLRRRSVPGSNDRRRRSDDQVN